MAQARLGPCAIWIFACLSCAPQPSGTPPGDAPASQGSTVTAGGLDRSVLPIREPAPPTFDALDAREVKAPPRFAVTAPDGAPNVLVVVIDDIGFGQSSAFGGPIAMPALDRLAEGGVRYNRFHTTALCSPTRMAIQTGRNHHSVNTGGIMEVATAFPGNTGVRPQSMAPFAEVLRQNGYNTAAFGKWHETPPWEASTSGPYDRWPTRSGYERFYGFIGGDTNQWTPDLVDGTTKIDPPDRDDYHLTTDLADRAIAFISEQQALTPDKPFMVYFATGATHAPHHAPREYIDRYRGRFEEGWDVYREKTLARQIEIGVVPAGTKLAARPDAIPAWDTLGDEQKKVYARQMEVFAGFAEHTDHEIGRVVDAITSLGEIDNTLIFVLVGDNGASAEGGANGLVNENTYFNAIPETIEMQLAVLDRLGGPTAFNHYAAGWAVAGNTPFMWTKQVASNFGGIRNGLIVHWPSRITDKGTIRSQFHHVIDMAPTILEVAGVPAPRIVDGVEQSPIEGVSMQYTFADAKAADRRTTQYFEMIGNRAIYHEGWFAGTIHKAPWERDPRRPLTEDIWELYNVDQDFSQSTDLAAQEPERLEDLQAVFLREAKRYHVLPIDDRSIERLDPRQAGRPDLMGERETLTFRAPVRGIPENAFLNMKNRSYTITAEIDVPAGGGDGVIVCQGGRFGGWSLWVDGGRLTYTYNFLNMERVDVVSSRPLPAGKQTVRAELAYDGGGQGKGGTLSLFVGDENVAEGRIERTMSNVLSLGDGADVGSDSGTPVSEDYDARDNALDAGLTSVTIQLG